MHKTFSLTDRFLFVLTSYLPMGFSNAEWCRTMYDLYRNTAFSILTNDKTEKMGNTYLWCFDNAFTFKSDH